MDLLFFHYFFLSIIVPGFAHTTPGDINDPDSDHQRFGNSSVQHKKVVGNVEMVENREIPNYKMIIQDKLRFNRHVDKVNENIIENSTQIYKTGEFVNILYRNETPNTKATGTNPTIIVERQGEVKDSNEKDNSHVNKMDTFDNFYYDWGFGFGNIAPGLSPPDARFEGTTTTDISCWDCDQEKGMSPLLVRCDYTLVFNSKLSPKGFSCIQYQVTLGSKIYNKARCAYAASSFYDPCEEVVKENTLPGKTKNCKICYHDGCNAICNNKDDFPLIPLLPILGFLMLCCLCAVCVLARMKIFCKKSGSKC